MQWLDRLFNKVLALWPLIVIVEPTEQAGKITFGKHYKIIGPGWYIIWPIIHRITLMDVITQVVDLKPQTVQTITGQNLVVSGAIQYHIRNVEKALFAVQDVDKALSTVALGIILEYVQKRRTEELRDVSELKEEIRKGVTGAASGWGLSIEKVYITDLGVARNIRLLGDNVTWQRNEA